MIFNDDICMHPDSITPKNNLNIEIERQANAIIKNIMKGEEIVSMQRISFAELSPLPYQEESSDKYLDRVEGVLESLYKSEKDNRRVWTVWYFLSCLRLVRGNRRKGTHDLPARGAKVANHIINSLIRSHGLNAMGVYNRLSGRLYLPVI